MKDFFDITIGLTQSFQCSYLTEQQEQLLVIRDQRCYNSQVYQQLMTQGFRRSGNDIYRPNCPSCNACQSIRIPAAQFVLSRSQKRLSRLCKQQFQLTVDTVPDQQAYQLYEKYINTRHYQGAMYPPTRSQYESFLLCDWLDVIFLHIWQGEKLVAVAVTDHLPNSLSAIYSFFDPDYEKYSLGSWCILQQLSVCQRYQKEYLYLGYQIDECDKMNYKVKYLNSI